MAKILIIEDDLAFGTMIQTWLRKKGFEVEKATSVGGPSDDLYRHDLRGCGAEGCARLEIRSH